MQNDTQMGFRARDVGQKEQIKLIAAFLGINPNQAMKEAADLLIEKYAAQVAIYQAERAEEGEPT